MLTDVSEECITCILGRKSADEETSMQLIVNPLPPAARWYVARFISDPENESDTFLRNVGSRVDHTAL
jgi:hypothetical protein